MSFDPPAWMGPAFDDYARKQLALSAAIERNRPYLYERVPCDPAWLAGRAEFAKRWGALRAEGFEQGWLEQDSCYECGGEVVVTTNTTNSVRRPNPDYVPLPPGDTITIPRG